MSSLGGDIFQVYDHDGNVMQALDDVAIDANMSKILALPAYNETHQTMRIMDMGMYRKRPFNFTNVTVYPT